MQLDLCFRTGVYFIYLMKFDYQSKKIEKRETEKEDVNKNRIKSLRRTSHLRIREIGSKKENKTTATTVQPEAIAQNMKETQNSLPLIVKYTKDGMEKIQDLKGIKKK